MSRIGKYGIIFFILLAGFLPGIGPAHVQAKNSDWYTIDISKTTPKQSEKKLRKVKPTNRTTFWLRTKAKNKKAFKKELKSWLTKFQNLPANKYGILPFTYKDAIANREKSGRYLGAKYVGTVSDYVNMNTICEGAYARYQENIIKIKGRSVVLGSRDYYDKCLVSLSVNGMTGKTEAYTDTHHLEYYTYYDEEPVPLEVYSVSELKKQSDSVRVEIFMDYTRSCLKYDKKNKGSSKRHILYDMAKGKASGVCMDLARLHVKMIKLLAMNAKYEEVSTRIGEVSYMDNHRIAIFKLKNSFGSYDYFCANNTRFSRKPGPLNKWVEEKPARFSSNLIKEFLAWRDSEPITEREIIEIRQYNKKLANPQYIQQWIQCRMESDPEGAAAAHIAYPSRTVSFVLENQNKEKCGLDTVFGSFSFEGTDVATATPTPPVTSSAAPSASIAPMATATANVNVTPTPSASANATPTPPAGADATPTPGVHNTPVPGADNTPRPGTPVITYDGTNIDEIRNAAEPITVVIRDGVREIEEEAFIECDYLKGISIPESVTSIGDSAFYGCVNLTSINIPGSVTSIGNCAFFACNCLESISIPESVTSIGEGAFYGCISLTNISILEGVTSIGSYSFC